MIIKKLFFFILFTNISLDIFCQDIHYSQPFNYPLLINPALTGNYFGKSRAIAIFRTQNMSIAHSNLFGVYNSYGGSFETKILEDYLNDDGLSLGLYFNSDHSGEGTLSTNSIFFGPCYKLALDKYNASTLSFGIQAGMEFKRIYDKDLIFGNQVEGFDFNKYIPNFENLIDGSTKSNLNLNLGVFYNQLINENLSFNLGLSLYNISNTNSIFYETIKSNTYKRFNLIMGSNIYINENINISPSIVYMIQGPQSQINIGSTLTSELNNPDFNLIFGLRNRLNDGLMALAGIKYKNTKYMFNYDHTISSLSKSNNSYGAIEFSIQHIFGEQKESFNFSKMHCPTF